MGRFSVVCHLSPSAPAGNDGILMNPGLNPGALCVKNEKSTKNIAFIDLRIRACCFLRISHERRAVILVVVVKETTFVCEAKGGMYLVRSGGAQTIWHTKGHVCENHSTAKVVDSKGIFCRDGHSLLQSKSD